MGSIARQRAKPLLEVAGAPVLSHIADRVVELEDLSEVVVITNSRFYGQFLEWASTYRAPVPLQILDDGSTRVEDQRGAVGDLAFGVQAVPPQEEDWVVMAAPSSTGGIPLTSGALNPNWPGCRDSLCGREYRARLREYPITRQQHSLGAKRASSGHE